MGNEDKKSVVRAMDTLLGNPHTAEPIAHLVEILSRNYNPSNTGGKEWQFTKSKHQTMMLKNFVKFMKQSSESQYIDDSSLNPLRTIWELCFENLAKESIRATNVVNNDWHSSGRDLKNLKIQKNAAKTLKTVERIFIVDPSQLGRNIFWDLRTIITQQLGASLKIYIIPPAYSDVPGMAKLKSRDFILFDDRTLYNTIVDKTIDKREKQATKVEVTEDSNKVAAAKLAWSELIQNSDQITLDNMDDILVPGTNV